MSSALHGRIHHRLRLPESSSDVHVSRKRKHSGIIQNKNDLSNSQRTSYSQPGSSSSKDSSRKTLGRACGFIFVSEDLSHPSQEYLLSLPKNLLKIACEAVIDRREVSITSYTVFSLQVSSSAGEQTTLCSSSKSTTTTTKKLSKSDITILEVHTKGLEILPYTYQDVNDGVHTNISDRASLYTTENLWTLSQFWRKEMIDDKFSLEKSREKISIIGTVDAISPIIALDPINPFALIEIYDKDNTDITSVVVLNGNSALLCHSAIFPLDTLIFRNVIYKPWSIAKSLSDNVLDDHSQLLLKRFPSNVFVATDSQYIPWRRTLQSIDYADNKTSIPPIITPVNLMTTIRGRIQYVQTLTLSSNKYTATTVHYVDLISDLNEMHSSNPSKSTSVICSRLYLTHFPMSTSLQCSLRAGAEIEACNVHLVLAACQCASSGKVHDPEMCDRSPWIAYGCCLRSTLVLSKPASEDCQVPTPHKLPHTQTRIACRNSSTSSLHASTSEISMKMDSPWRHHGFWKCNHTYLWYLYRCHIDNYLLRNFREDKRSVSFRNRKPNLWMLDVLLKLFHEGNNTHHDLSQKPRAFRRNPYMEFFDHPFAISAYEKDTKDNLHSKYCGCFMSSDEIYQSSSHKVLLDLTAIRSASHKCLTKRLSAKLPLQTDQDSFHFEDMRAGWTGAIHINIDDLFSERTASRSEQGVDDNAGSDCHFSVLNYYIAGFVGETHSSLSGGDVAAVFDDNCQIPVAFFENMDRNPKMNDFVMAKVESVTISCLCLGLCSNPEACDNDSGTDPDQTPVSVSASLPSLYASNHTLLGGCSLLFLGQLAFISAIQVHCKYARIFDANGSHLTIAKESDFVNIETCISDPIEYKKPSYAGTVRGTLTRRMFQTTMNKDGSHTVGRLSISSCTGQGSSLTESDTSCLQEMGVTLNVSQNTAILLKLNEKHDYICPQTKLSDAQKQLASGFWTFGDSGRTVALTLGGSEDLVPESRCSKVSVLVFFPVSTIRITKAGHMRACCVQGELDSLFFYAKKMDHDSDTSTGYAVQFDFKGGLKSMKGMLMQRPRRRSILRVVGCSRRSLGELLSPPSNAIPTYTLSHLFNIISKQLQCTSRILVSSTLVRRIMSAHFLGVSFCQVQCYCTRCFCPLVDLKEEQDEIAEEETFWHLPLPGEALLGDFEISATHSNNNQSKQSFFRCPNQCPPCSFGVRWECSGMIDDGTGQATLYADGEAALMLLGMSSKVITCIEDGLWNVPGGRIVFKRSIPPSNELRSRIGILNAKLDNFDHTIRSLPMRFKAEYFLETYCRSSKIQRRPLEYYVRCKKPVSKFQHLHHTTIDTFFDEGGECPSGIFRSDEASYTLPALKLELVDCGVATRQRERTMANNLLESFTLERAL